MKKILLLLMMLQGISLSAQNNGFVMDSLDPAGDSASVVKIRARMAQIRKERPTVALVLSGGGAKGASHVGVLRCLEEKGIPIDLVCGASMGGLVGGLYALGHNAITLDSLFRNTNWSVMMSDKIPLEFYSFERRRQIDTYALSFPVEFGTKQYRGIGESLPDGYLYGLNIYNTINALSVNYQDDMEFSELPIPFACTATDLITIKQKNFFRGNLPEAIRSTISIPLVFKPVRTDDGSILLDGGMRDNYPVDIARSLGADIVIGVDLQEDDEKFDNFAQILMQTMFGMGLQAHEKTKNAADILIRPDMSGFWTMSFSTDEIAQIIQRGYEAAQNSGHELDTLKKMLGNSTPRRKPAGKDIIHNGIRIGTIVYKGIPVKEGGYFFKKTCLRENRAFTSRDFEHAVAEIYSSGLFNSVRYRICGNKEPYTVEFICEPGPRHQMNVAGRIDSEDIISAQFNMGFWQNTISGPKIDATIKLGASSKAVLDAYLTPMKGPRIGILASAKFNNIPNFKTEDGVMNQSFWYNYGELYLQDRCWSNVMLRCGARVDYTSRIQYLTGFSGFLEFGVNTEDNSYFPTKGIKFQAGAEALVCEYADGNWMDDRSYNAALSIEVPMRLSDRFTIVGFAAGRIVLGNEKTSLVRSNMLGGTVQGRYFDHQLPFFGISGAMVCGSRLATATLDFRTRIGKSNYLSLLAGGFADSEKFGTVKNAVWAAGIKYAIPTKLGLLDINIHWDSLTRNVGFYAGLGYSF